MRTHFALGGKSASGRESEAFIVELAARFGMGGPSLKEIQEAFVKIGDGLLKLWGGRLRRPM